MKALTFFKEVKSETKKVTWPSRKETMMTVGLVVFTAFFMGLFFLLVDSVIYRVVQFILAV